MRTRVTMIELHMVKNIGCHATVWRTGGNNDRRYHHITPASFARIQRAQAAMMRKMFGRSK